MKKQIEKTIAKNNESIVEEELKQEEINAQKKSFAIILGSILIIIMLMFAILNLFLDDGTDNIVNDETPTTNEILMGSILTKSANKYNILVINDDCTNCDAAIEKLDELKDSGQIYYTVDASSAFNSNYVYNWIEHSVNYPEETNAQNNKNPEILEDIKIADFPTLLSVEDGAITEFVEGLNSIQEYLE